MRRLLRVAAAVISLVAGLVAGGVGVLAVTVPRPRPSAGWTRLADMPEPRGETATAVLGRLAECPEGRCTATEHVVVAGGIAGFGRTVRTVNRYFPASDVWIAGPNLPEPRDHAAAAAMHGAVFVSGGSLGLAGTPEPNLWVMRADGSGWDVLEPMPEGRWGHSMVAFGDRLYVIGGRGRTARVLVYDPATGWSRSAPMPRPRNHLAAVVVDGLLWAIGGRDDSGVLRRVDVYDPLLDIWVRARDLPVAMSAMAAGVVDGEVHVAGGERPSLRGGVIDRHYRLGVDDVRWRPASRPIVAVHGTAGAVVDGWLVIAGGSRRQGALSVLGWTGVTQGYSPRYASTDSRSARRGPNGESGDGGTPE